MAWVKPATTTTRAGSASTPRLRPRYAASIVRNTSDPRGSPYPKISCGALDSTRRVDASHWSRGNSDTSGLPAMSVQRRDVLGV
jgi:hypothetical protein